MSKANADIEYDPELPFVVRLQGGDRGINSRFKYRNEAETHIGTATWLELVDTTPKPKIPGDAEFIYWTEGSEKMVAVHENFNPNKPWELGGVFYSERDILDFIGDAEVTVLVRKEES